MSLLHGPGVVANASRVVASAWNPKSWSKWSEYGSSLFEVIKKTGMKENSERYFSAFRCPILTIDDSNERWKPATDPENFRGGDETK